jgi:hypothetical protein
LLLGCATSAGARNLVFSFGVKEIPADGAKPDARRLNVFEKPQESAAKHIEGAMRDATGFIYANDIRVRALNRREGDRSGDLAVAVPTRE